MYSKFPIGEFRSHCMTVNLITQRGVPAVAFAIEGTANCAVCLDASDHECNFPAGALNRAAPRTFEGITSVLRVY